MEDILAFIEELAFINNNLLLPVSMNGNGDRLWMVTTSLDKVNKNNKGLYMFLEGESYMLPNYDDSGIIGWYNTADGNIYKPGEVIKVIYGTHFEAIYK